MKYFKDSEFRCPCGCGRSIKDMQEEILIELDRIREKIRIPIIITSSIRCSKHNKEVGGSPTSSHLLGCAVDISCNNNVDRMKLITALLTSSFTRIGIGKTFIHADCDHRKTEYVMWIY